jgi:hypothetical protein
MNDESPSSLPPSRIPGASKTGPLIGLAALLLVAGAVVYFLKSSVTPQPKPPVVPPSIASTPVERPTLADAPPPPPDDEPPSPEPTAKKPRSVVAACGGPCSGNAPSGMVTEVQARATRAQGCYQRALRQNEGLRGSMSVALRVDGGGTICNASVASDTTGSPEVARCVVGMFQGQRLGSAPSGGCVDMKVPLRFEAVNR